MNKMEELLINNDLKLPEMISGKLTHAKISITPEGTDEVIPASWGYLPVGVESDDFVLPRREKIFKVDYSNLKNLPYASHEQAGYCKIWIWENSKPVAVRGFYFEDLENKSFSACLITDNTNLIYI